PRRRPSGSLGIRPQTPARLTNRVMPIRRPEPRRSRPPPAHHPNLKDDLMPKMKTSKTAAKRFRKTGTGKLRRLQALRGHLLEKKPSTRARRLDGYVAVHSGDEKKIKRLLGER